jgi:hypothetical protein
MNDEKEMQSVRESMLKVFNSDDGVVVLRHLTEFARADDASFCADPRMDAYLQGRRSVVMEIRKVMSDKR